MASNLDKFQNIKKVNLGGLNIAEIKKTNPIVRAEDIIDNKLAVFHELMFQSAFQSKFTGLLEFRAIVLLRLTSEQADSLRFISGFFPTNQSSKTEFSKFICMVPELDAVKPDPFDLLRNGKIDDFYNICLNFYNLYEVDSYINGELAAELDKAETGSIVNIRFSDTNYDHGYVTKVISTDIETQQIALETGAGKSSSQAFEAGNSVVSPDAVAFYNKLRASGAFRGYSDAMLMALTANAQAESNFYSNAAGDARTEGNKDYPKTIRTTNGTNGVEANYCSFGYFQLNICPDTAEGSLFIDFFGLDRSNPQEVLDAITDEEKQFQFMANRLTQIGTISKYLTQEVADGLSEEETAAFYGGLIARDFEKCAGCADGGSKNQQRQQLARALYEELRIQGSIDEENLYYPPQSEVE